MLETPPVVVMGIRAYQQDTHGLKTMTDVLADGLSEDLTRTITLPEEDGAESKIEELKKKLDEIDEIRVIIHTKPRLASVPKKKPEILECGLGGADAFADGEHVDTIAVTKGKGFQGPVKRFGVRIQYGKAKRSSKARVVGSIGPWSPSRTMWTVPMAGQMGYHKRTEYNKKILKIGEATEVDEINPEGGFVKYGLVKNNYVLLKGSVPGPSKRLVMLRKAVRPHGKHNDPAQISYISTKSKQGV